MYCICTYPYFYKKMDCSICVNRSWEKLLSSRVSNKTLAWLLHFQGRNSSSELQLQQLIWLSFKKKERQRKCGVQNSYMKNTRVIKVNLCQIFLHVIIVTFKKNSTSGRETIPTNSWQSETYCIEKTRSVVRLFHQV